MNIVDNFKNEVKSKLEDGEIVKGEMSGNYYMVIDKGTKLLQLHELYTTSLAGTVFVRTGIKRENVTITFK